MLLGVISVFILILCVIYYREKAKMNNNDKEGEGIALFLKTSNFIEAILYSISSFFICSIIFNVVNT